MKPQPEERDWQGTISSLREAFGAPFRVTVLSNVTESCLKAVLQPISEGKSRLIIPIGEGAGEAVVAVGTLDTRHDQVQTGLLKLAGRLIRESHEAEELRLDLDECARQLSYDFEELHWLRGQLQHLKDCSAKSSAEDIREKVLLPLSTMIRAQGIVLVSADRAGTPPGQKVPRVGKEVLRAAPEKLAVDGAVCCQLVDHWRETARRQPLVENEVDRRREFSMVAGVHCCILAPVTRQETCLGWLLAVNRTKGPTDAEGADEFGSVEAGLMESAAAILTLHPGCPELFESGENASAEKEAVLAE